MQSSELIFFGPSERARAGFLHRAAKPGRAGVVICNPFGGEAICAHRSLRAFADTFANIGLPTLRFDYDGTGDSAGLDRAPGRLDAWVDSTRDAIRAIRELTGVERVYLVGVRLGVLIATLASAGRPDVGGIVAVAPVVSGKAYLRELTMLQSSLALESPPAGIALDAIVGEGAQEAAGFLITQETRAALGAINLAKLDAPPGAGQPLEVLVLDRDDRPASDPWIAKLEECGVAVDARRLPGYVEMTLDPHRAIVPEKLLDAAKEWLGARAALGSAAPVTAPRREAIIGDVIEEAVFVDDAKRVFGILSRPRMRKASKRALVLLNAGTIHHIGPNRLYVTLARKWAAAGHEVLRLDITGIGESRTPEGIRENLVYSPRAMEDTALAIDLLRRRGATDVWLVGFCSGAYYAYKSAVVGRPVSGFVAINPLFFDNPPEENDDFPKHRVTREITRYRGAVRDIEKWKKLLRGKVRVQTAAKALLRHAAGRILRLSREAARILNVSLQDDVGRSLEEMAARSIAQHFIFASGDPGHETLHDDGGSTVTRLKKKRAISVEIIDGPDHTFTPVWSHDLLRRLLDTAMASSASHT